MDFKDAYQEMRDGSRVCLPDDTRAWLWSKGLNSVGIADSDGRIMDIRQSDDVHGLMTSINREDWELFDEPSEDIVPEAYWWDELEFNPEEPPIFKRGDRGDEIRELQKELKKYGASLGVDGVFGKNVQTAVKNIQAAYGLIRDGIFGQKTAEAMRGQIVPGTATHEKMLEVADRIGCSVEACMAVSMVESRGRGFWSNGFPVILYERLWMYRMLKRSDLSFDLRSLVKSQPNIVNTRGGGYKGGVDEYTRLNKAKGIHVASALQSASWCAYQVMGFNWEALDYESPRQFVSSMKAHENNHLEAFARYILNDSRLVKALQGDEPDFHSFAIIYNGPRAVEQNQYPTKMSNHFTSLVKSRRGE